MSKIHPQKYRTLSGEVKINCYTIQIAKSLLEKVGINETTELKITSNNNKIIIEGDNNENEKKKRL